MPDTKQNEEAVKEAKAQARKGEPRSEAPVEDKESASEAKERRAAATSEATYSRERLIDDAAAFGVPRYVVAGALASQSKQNFTHDEVRALIEKRKSHKVS